MNSLTPDTLQLRGMNLPDPIGWWPVAPGWWLLLTVFCLTLGLAVYAFYRYRRSITRQGLQSLTQIRRAFNRGELDSKQLLVTLNQLLKQVALVKFPERAIAHLSGEAWLCFLQDTAKIKDPVALTALQILVAGPYQPETEEYDPQLLLNGCKRWIKNAKRR